MPTKHINPDDFASVKIDGDILTLLGFGEYDDINGASGWRRWRYEKFVYAILEHDETTDANDGYELIADPQPTRWRPSFDRDNAYEPEGVYYFTVKDLILDFQTAVGFKIHSDEYLEFSRRCRALLNVLPK